MISEFDILRGEHSELIDIRQDMGDCQRCALHSGRKNIVFGEGNPSATIMFIGEAPGRNEDESGRPFCGRSGDLLNEGLDRAGLTRNDVYIANIVKCRPPSNRDPSPMEKEICTQFLHRQLEVIQPKVIVTLGRVAASYILGRDVQITKERGVANIFSMMPTVPVVMIYHPAFILRNRNSIHEENFFEDIKNVRRMVENGNSCEGTTTTGVHRDGVG